MKKLLRFDWASKYLLKTKSHYGILEGFLRELTGEHLKIKGVLGSTNQSNGSDEKSGRIDYLVESSRGEIILQLQNNRESNYMQRMVYGSMKSCVDNFQGYSVPKSKKLICINIVYSPAQDDDYFYKGKISFDAQNKNAGTEVYKINGYSKNDIRDMFPEYYLIYVYNFKDVIKSGLDEWIYYFKHADVKENFTSHGLNEVRDKFALGRLSEEEKKKYDAYLNTISNDPLEILQLRLKTESMLKEKERHTKVEIARALKNQFVPVEIISTSTGLSIPEVQNL
jgi:hypothetical protein